MTDDSAGFDDGVDDSTAFDDSVEFDDAFFTALETGPEEDPAEAVADDIASGDELDLDVEGDGGVDEFLYEAEGDGSFETEAAEFETDDFPFDLGGEA